jgi:GTPase SAR1 family protein
LNDRKTFVNLAHWLQEIKDFDVQGAVYLVGCKSDLDTEVPTDEILSFAETYKASYIQTSAKDNVGVSEAFRKIIEEAVQANLINMAFSKD